MNVNIYILKDPTTQQVRYIGQAVNVLKRLHRHIEVSRDLNNTRHISNWIRSLSDKPLLEIVDNCDSFVCNKRERYWIRYYREMGCDLCNLSNGGEGAGIGNKNCVGRILSDETKEKIRRGNRQSKQTLHIESQNIYGSLKEACNTYNIAYVNEYYKMKRGTSKIFLYITP